MDSKRDKIRRIFTILLLFKYLRSVMTTNIDCRGKPFHCANSTHFMICVDLGSGVTKTVNDFTIKCPPTTSCHESNQFECEYQWRTTTHLPFRLVDETNGLKMDATTPLDYVNTASNLQKTFVTRIFNKNYNTIDMKTNSNYIPKMQTLRQIEISDTPAQLTTNTDNQESIKNTIYDYITTKQKANTVEDHLDFTLSHRDSQATTEKSFETDITNIIANKTNISNTNNLNDEADLEESIVSFLFDATPGTIGEVASTLTTQEIVQAGFLMNMESSILNGTSSKFRDIAKLTSKFDLNEEKEKGNEFSTTPPDDLAISEHVIDTNQTIVATTVSSNLSEEQTSNLFPTENVMETPFSTTERNPITFEYINVNMIPNINNQIPFDNMTMLSQSALRDKTVKRLGKNISKETQKRNDHDVMLPETSTNLEVTSTTLIDNNYSYYKTTSKEYQTMTPETGLLEYTIQQKTKNTISPLEEYETKLTFTEGITANDNLITKHLPFILDPTTISVKNGAYSKKGKSNTYMPSSDEFNNQFENSTVTPDLKAVEQKIQSKTAPIISSYELSTSKVTIPDEKFTKYTNIPSDYVFTTEPSLSTLELKGSSAEQMTDTNKIIESVITTNNDMFLLPFKNPQDSLPEVVNTTNSTLSVTFSDTEKAATTETYLLSPFQDGYMTHENASTVDLTPHVDYTTQSTSSVVTDAYFDTTSPYVQNRAFKSASKLIEEKVHNKINSTTALHRNFTFPDDISMNNENTSSNFQFTTVSSPTTIQLPITSLEHVTDTNKNIESYRTRNVLNKLLLLPHESSQVSLTEVQDTSTSPNLIQFDFFSNTKKEAITEMNFGNFVTVFNNDSLTYEIASTVELQDENITEATPSEQTKNRYFTGSFKLENKNTPSQVNSIDQKLKDNQNRTLLQHGHYDNISEVISLEEVFTENVNTYDSLIQTESLMLGNNVSTISSFYTLGAVDTIMNTDVFRKGVIESITGADDLLPHKVTISMTPEEDVTTKNSISETTTNFVAVNSIDKPDIMNRVITNFNVEDQEYAKGKNSSSGINDYLIGAGNISLNINTVIQDGLTKKANASRQNLDRDFILMGRNLIFTSTENPSIIENNISKGNLPIVDLAYNYSDPDLMAESNTKVSNKRYTMLTKMQHKISQGIFSPSKDKIATEKTSYTEQIITTPQTGIYKDSYATGITTEKMTALHSLPTTGQEPFLADEEAWSTAPENIPTLNITKVNTEKSIWQGIYPAVKESLVTSESNILTPPLTSLQTNLKSKDPEKLLPPKNTTFKKVTKNKYDNLLNTTNKNTFRSTFSTYNITVKSNEKDMVSNVTQNMSRLYSSTASLNDIIRNKENNNFENTSTWVYENNQEVQNNIINNTDVIIGLEGTAKVVSEQAINNITEYNLITTNTNSTISNEAINSYNSKQSNVQSNNIPLHEFIFQNKSIIGNKYVHNVTMLETGKTIETNKNIYMPSSTYMAYTQESNKSSISQTVTTVPIFSNDSIKLQPLENNNASARILTKNIDTREKKLNATTEERVSYKKSESGNIQPGRVSIKRSVFENTQSLNDNNKEITTNLWKTAYETTTQSVVSSLNNNRNQSTLHSRIDIGGLGVTKSENKRPIQSVDFGLTKIKNTTYKVDIVRTTNRATISDDMKVNKNVDVDLFSCWNRFRGRYSDRKDCRKFYICVGKVQPVHGECPAGTVFSEIKKQCTKNLSHCIRNNQFHCIQEGRFSDLLKSNIYYICVKMKNKFIRFQFQCSKGYHLNKANVRCVHDMKTPPQSTSISNDNDSNKGSEQSTVEKSKEKKQVTYIDTNICKAEGKFPDADDCRRYYVCSKNSKSGFKRKIKKCDSDEVFHREKKKCVDSDSYECK